MGAHLDHDERVAGLHAEQEIVVVIVSADVSELEGGLHHATRRVAIVAQNARREAAMVGANAHGAVQGLARLNQRREHLAGTQRTSLQLWTSEAYITASACDYGCPSAA